MKIIISNCIEIQKPTRQIKNFVRTNLTYVNPEYNKMKNMGFYRNNISREIRLYYEYGKSIYTPVGFFNKLYKFHPVPSDYIDCSVVKKIDIDSGIQLRDYQELATQAIEKYMSGIFVLPCGMGKTELALECVNRLQQKTLWLTHTRDLVKQAKERTEAKMTCATSLITDGKIDTSGDIVFSTVQTLIKFIDSGKLRQDEFGMIIVDECFPKGTKISTPKGYKNIEDIKIGDIVYSYNHKTNNIEEKKVNYLFNKKTDKLINIKLSNNKVITCTPNHPIFVNGEYKRADEIRIGDELYEIGSNKNTDVIKTNNIKKQKTIVYNIGVEDNHNYFVDDILVHNCHRTSTNPQSLQMFRTCIEYFAARYRLGLTATLHRADGLENCITNIIGDVIYEIKKDKNEYVCWYENRELLRFPVDSFQVPAYINVIETNYNVWDKDVFDPNGGTIQYAKLITDIANDRERNELILKTLRGVNGCTIVLSDRIDQLKYLCDRVENGVQIDGSTPKKIRERALELARLGRYKYLFASYSLAKEGLDVKILSNLVMATPVRDFAIVTQSIGRIQRPYEGKTCANVYDFVDPTGMLYCFFADRRRTYRKNNWQMNTAYVGGNK